MPFELDHLGIAVKSLAAAKALYEKLGLSVSPEEIVEHERVRLVMIPVGETRLELLEPTADDSVIGRFIAKRGEGLHHVGYRVDSCAEVLEDVKGQGARVVDEHPRTGSRGTTVAFMHPKSAFGTLIELVEE